MYSKYGQNLYLTSLKRMDVAEVEDSTQICVWNRLSIEEKKNILVFWF